MMRFIRLFSTVKDQPRKQSFLNLVKPPLGLIKPLSPEQKAKINEQITKKMEELQNTGLSKQEILLSKSQKGLPLKIDPFFQFLKQNWLARQIYLKKNDKFTVQNVIDIALRQDIGADPSMSRIRQPHQVDTQGRAELMNQLRDHRQGKFNPEAYDGTNNFSVQKAYNQLKPHQALRHYFKPLDRYQKRQQNIRRIKKFDIHWRNVELLRQFVTINGNIKSRYRSFLSDRDQRAVRTAIKTARIMGVMPYFGRTPQPLKRNITSLEDQVQQFGYQHVNLQTGHLFQTRSRSMDSLQVQIENENDLNFKYNRMKKEGKNFKLWVNSLQNQKTVEAQQLNSQKYARYLKQIEVQQSSKTKEALQQNIYNILKGISKYRPLFGEELTKISPSNDQICKKQFENVKKKVVNKINQDPLSILDKILNQKLKI